MTDEEKKRIVSEPPPPTDEIDDEWGDDDQTLVRELPEGVVKSQPVPPSDVVAWFPDVHASNRPGGSDLEERTILGSDHERLGARLESLARTAFPIESASLPWPRIQDALHRAWGESWTPTLRLDAAAKLRATELVRLDDEQCALAHDCVIRGRMLIVGGPGTGKSVVARAIASTRWPVATRSIPARRSTTPPSPRSTTPSTTTSPRPAASRSSSRPCAAPTRPSMRATTTPPVRSAPGA